MIAVPLTPATATPLGTLSVVSRQPAAYDEADGEVLTALADPGLDRDPQRPPDRGAGPLARGHRATRRGRAGAARDRDPDHRDPRAGRPAPAHRRRGAPPAPRGRRGHRRVRRRRGRPGLGLRRGPDRRAARIGPRAAAADRRGAVRPGDGRAPGDRRRRLPGRRVPAHRREPDAMAAPTGIGDLIVAPIIGDEGPLGAIEVYRRDRHAFDDIDAAVLGGLADQAAIAITNARLIEELERSQAAVARRADTERALRDITARIAALREPEVILDRVVEEARAPARHGRCAPDPDGRGRAPTSSRSSSPARPTPRPRPGCSGMEFPLGGGINGLAAERGEPVWTHDYTADPRIPHEGDDDEVADRPGPVRDGGRAPARPGGEVIGTLAISSAKPRAFHPEELDLLQGLADQAAIAITNSTLLTRLTRVGGPLPDARLVIAGPRLRDRCRRPLDVPERPGQTMLGWDIDATHRPPFQRVRRPGLGASWPPRTSPSSRPTRRPSTRLGSTSAAATAGRSRSRSTSSGPCDDGRLSAIHGVARDISERERLERELRESQERYRFLVENSPDVVFSTDADGRFTFMSETMERMTGWRPEELIGAHFSTTVEPRQPARGASAGRRSIATIRHRAGRTRSTSGGPTAGSSPSRSARSRWSTTTGRFAGIHGSTRDISERVAPRARAARVRGALPLPRRVLAGPGLADRRRRDAAPSSATRRRTMLGIDPTELIGRPVRGCFAPAARRDATTASVGWPAIRAPSTGCGCRSGTPTASDVPVEINGTGMTDRRRLHRGARRRPRRQRARPARARPAPPGRRARGERGARPPRPRAPRLGHPGAVLDDPRDALGRAAARPRRRRGAADQLAQLRDLQREALAEMRALIFELRPGDLEQDGLVRALRTHTARAPGPDRAADRRRERRSTSGCRSPIEEVALPDRPGGAPQRRQARRRARRSGSRSAGRRRGVRLRIVDDGKGFDPASVPDGHLGLAGMRARADRIGARFTVRQRRPARGRRSRSSSRTRRSRPAGPRPAATGRRDRSANARRRRASSFGRACHGRWSLRRSRLARSPRYGGMQTDSGTTDRRSASSSSMPTIGSARASPGCCGSAAGCLRRRQRRPAAVRPSTRRSRPIPTSSSSTRACRRSDGGLRSSAGFAPRRPAFASS